ncbi:hypothetical protein NMY22_g13316 [Coprinellus aureogranulatus]|nr:hypothetical protein NMY22_g13316 [Coprinellus aureogranulatus]
MNSDLDLRLQGRLIQVVEYGTHGFVTFESIKGRMEALSSDGTRRDIISIKPYSLYSLKFEPSLEFYDAVLARICASVSDDDEE